MTGWPIAEELEYKDLKIVIEYEQYLESPRKEYDNMGHLVFTDNRELTGDGIMSVDEMNEILADPDAIWLPVYVFSHSGITVRTYPFSCPWDSWLGGIIYVYRNEAVKWGGFTIEGEELDEQIRKNLQGEVDTYDQFLRGDVYWFKIVKEDDDDEYLDSCGWIYGFEWTKQYALESAKAVYENSWHQLPMEVNDG